MAVSARRPNCSSPAETQASTSFRMRRQARTSTVAVCLAVGKLTTPSISASNSKHHRIRSYPSMKLVRSTFRRMTA